MCIKDSGLYQIYNMSETSGVFEKSNILTVHVALQSSGFQYELFSNLSQFKNFSN